MGRSRDGGPAGRGQVPDRLGDALDCFLSASGIKIAWEFPDLAKAWEHILGREMASHAKVSKFQRGVLEITVDSSALMSEMQFARPMILRHLQEEVRKPFVSEIRWVLTAPHENDVQE